MYLRSPRHPIKPNLPNPAPESAQRYWRSARCREASPKRILFISPTNHLSSFFTPTCAEQNLNPSTEWIRSHRRHCRFVGESMQIHYAASDPPLPCSRSQHQPVAILRMTSRPSRGLRQAAAMGCTGALVILQVGHHTRRYLGG